MLALSRMQTVLSGNNIGILVLARQELLIAPKAHLKIITNSIAKTDETHLWETVLPRLATEFESEDIGLLYDRKNKTLPALNPGFRAFPTSVLKDMALEGLADSVEFRRIARKEIRKAKQANCSILIFPESIFGESKTQKILQHLAGSQLQIQTITDYYQTQSQDQAAREIEIIHDEDETWMAQRAETILRTKLKK